MERLERLERLELERIMIEIAGMWFRLDDPFPYGCVARIGDAWKEL